MKAATWRSGGVQVSAPATVTLTGRPRRTAQPRAQVCAARTKDGEPAIHLGLFDLPAEQWAEGVATLEEALALAMALVAQVLIAQRQWGRA